MRRTSCFLARMRWGSGHAGCEGEFVRRRLLRAARAAGCRCSAPRWQPRGAVTGLAAGLVVVGVWSRLKNFDEISLKFPKFCKLGGGGVQNIFDPKILNQIQTNFKINLSYVKSNEI